MLFSCYVVSNTLQPHGLQHTGFLALYYLPEFAQTHAHWGGDTIQISRPLLSPFFSCPQSLPASGSFPMSQFFPPGGQSIGAWALTSVLPRNIQGWFPSGLTSLIKNPCLVFCKTDSYPPIFIKYSWLQQKPASTNTNTRKGISERISGHITQVMGKNAVRCQEWTRTRKKKCQNWGFSAFLPAFACFSFHFSIHMEVRGYPTASKYVFTGSALLQSQVSRRETMTGSTCIRCLATDPVSHEHGR